MTAEVIEKALVGCLADGVTGNLPELKTDFRRLEVRYKCEAGNKQYLCKGIMPSPTGSCSYYASGTCHNHKDLLDG